MAPRALRDLRLALVCPSVGQTRRGYERFMTDLCRLLAPEVQITLFKGAGAPGAGEVVIPHLRRTGRLGRLLGGRLRRLRYHLEFATFARAVAPRLARGRFDLVHFIDPPLCRPLHAARRSSRARHRLLFTYAIPIPYTLARWVDHVHCLTPTALQEAVASGIPADRLTMLPVGVDMAGLPDSTRREELRRRFGVSPETFVILAVTSLNRHHKRVDHLIAEAARLPDGFLLWIDGGTEPDGDKTLLDLARSRLGNRFRHTHVPSSEVGDLLSLADVMVSASLHEAFGMAVVEAMGAGLPVIVHDSAHFRWLVGDQGVHVDMRSPGALAGSLGEIRAGRPTGDPAARRQAVNGRFGWDYLKPGYLDMYARLGLLSPT